jgi:hypothetical protein
MPLLTEVRASPWPRPKRTKFKGAEEHAVFVLSRNLARENPLSRPHALPQHLSQIQAPELKVEHAASFPPRPPAADLLSKPHAPDHKPHPNDPGDRENIFNQGTLAKEMGSWVSTKV